MKKVEHLRDRGVDGSLLKSSARGGYKKCIIILFGITEGKLQCGRPGTKWYDTIKMHIKINGL
jgi:hypothetical protein